MQANETDTKVEGGEEVAPPSPEDPTVTDLAKQELGNWMGGGPKESNSTGSSSDPTAGNGGGEVVISEEVTTTAAEGSSTDPSITDLTKQEVGNWMGGGPKESSSKVESAGSSTDPTFTDLAKQELGNWMGGGPKESNSTVITPPNQTEATLEPGMEIPQTEEEEEEVNEEMEEWEEAHGKNKPKTTEEENEETEDSTNEDAKGDNEATIANTVEITAVPVEATPSQPTPNPLVVTPSWTPPKKVNKHTLATGTPTATPLKPRVPSPTRPPTPSAFATPTTTGAQETSQIVPETCHEFGPDTIDRFACEVGLPPVAAYGMLLVVPVVLVLCCWRICCGGRSKAVNDNERGKYRAISNTYGDPSYENAFTTSFSDEEDSEDETWAEGMGSRVLEMKNLGVQAGDRSLSLSEMNG